MKAILRNKGFRILWFGLLLGGSGQELYNLLPKHFELQGFAPETVGFIMSFTGLGGLLVLPFLVGFIDRFQKRRILMGVLTAHALVPLVYLIPLSPNSLYALPRLMQGMQLSVMMITFTALLSYVVAPERRGQGYAVFGVMGQLGILMGVNLGELAYDAAGMPAAYLLSLVFFVSAILMVRSLQEPEESAAGTLSLREGFKEILKSRGIYSTFIRITLLGFAMGFMLAFVPKIAISGGLARVSPFYAAYPLTVIAIRLTVGHYFDRVRRSLLMLAPLLIMPMSFIFAAAIDTPAELAGLGVFYGVAHGMLFPVLMSTLMNSASPAFRGRASVVFHVFFNGGMFVAANAGGLLIGVSLPLALYVSAAFTALGLVPYLFPLLQRRSG
jgi:MFS family permease